MINNKIAIIGLGCLFPGAETPEQFWQNLITGTNSTSIARTEDIGVDPAIFYEAEKGKADKTYYWRGGYVRNFQFDPTGYALPADFLASLDDLFQWSLYVAKMALTDSGYAECTEVLTKCGLILGNLSFPTRTSYRLFAPLYQQALEPILAKLVDRPEWPLANLPPTDSTTPISPYNGLLSGYPALVVAQALGLGTVRFSLDAACATSLYAIKMACQYLLSGRADLMLAGGVSCAHPLFLSTGFANFQAYPEQDNSLPLDQTSGGLTTGEGAGLIVLKRYNDALRDGDQIYATICDIGLSNDGQGKHPLTPNPKGQSLAFERAYSSSAIAPDTIDYVECHATGTALGDTTEVNSIASFFGQHQVGPYLGSVKSNLGHLLTAAGMAGVFKVILSMTHRVIPPTIQVTQPIQPETQLDNNAAPQIVTTLMPWPQKRITNSNQIDGQSVMRAGVNAFGFGGTNAHAILERTVDNQPSLSETPYRTTGKMAIVGMDAFFGSCEGLTAFEKTIYAGTAHFIPLPKKRWKGIEEQEHLLRNYNLTDGKAPIGAYIESFEIDPLKAKVPPNEVETLNSQQLLVLNVANNAIKDAKIPAGSNVAVIVALGMELALHRHLGRYHLSWQIKESMANRTEPSSPNLVGDLEMVAKEGLQPTIQTNDYVSIIGNVAASRIAALWNFCGPAFTVSDEENSVFRALEVAQMLLDEGSIEAVVVGAVDLAGGIEQVLLRHQLAAIHKEISKSSDNQSNAHEAIGEGAGAVVLRRYDASTADVNDSQVYAVIEAINLGTVQQSKRDAVSAHQTPTPQTVYEVCQKALAQSTLTPDDIGYVEASLDGIAEEHPAEIEGLFQAYQRAANPLCCAIGNVKQNIGHTYAASGMASLIKTALCLHRRFIPATPNWSIRWPDRADHQTQTNPFYIAPESRPWFLNNKATKRRAAISGAAQGGSYAHLILSEPDAVTNAETPRAKQTQAKDVLPAMSFHLYPLAANNQAELLAQLDDLQQMVSNEASLARIAQEAYWVFQNRKQAIYTLVIVAHHQTELMQEILRAKQGVPQAFSTKQDWKTPLGSYFTPHPLGASDISLVYPGAFTAYLGMGKDIYHLFPEMLERVTQQATQVDLGIEHILYPRSPYPLTAQDRERFEAEMVSNAQTMLKAGTAAAWMYTVALCDYFQLPAKSAVGYSLGEFSMLFALNVWISIDQACDDLHASPLFRVRLSGPKNAVRAYWGLPEAIDASEGDIWHTYVLLANVEAVRTAIEQEDRVYLTHINTPTEVAIAGDKQSCRRVIKRLECDFFRAPFNDVLHSEVMQSEYDDFVKLFSLPVHTKPNIDFYSAASDRPIALESASIAHNLAQALCKPLNFPQLINRVYEDGARIFIEMGPGGTCSRWISEILKNKAHVTVPVIRRGVDDYTAIIKTLATLLSHQVPLDLTLLYNQETASETQKKTMIKTITLGGPHIADVILTAENKTHFATLSNVQPDASVLQPITASATVEATPQSDPIIALPPSLPTPLSTPALHSANLRPYKQLGESMTRTDSAHTAFLRLRQNGLQQLSQLIDLQQRISEQMLNNGPIALATAPNMQAEQPKQTASPVEEKITPSRSDERPASSSRANSVVFDEAAVLEFANGKIVPVFGSDYAVIDTYPRRARLPSPPYLFVSRVTQLRAKRGHYEPCFIETEYDIPPDAWYATDGQVPVAVVIEASHSNIFLVSYLGIDFEAQGKRVYRALDGHITFVSDLPRAGDTLRCQVTMDSFAQNGDIRLFFYQYDCYVGERKVMEMRGIGGLFSDEDLAKAKGIEGKVKTPLTKIASSSPLGLPADIPIVCPATSFNETALQHLSDGHLAACFGEAFSHYPSNPALRLPPTAMRMIDRVTSLDPHAGERGLGQIQGEKILCSDAWYFNCHFKDDLCLPGALVGEACVQLLQFYLLYLGLHRYTTEAKFEPIPGLKLIGQSRGQITPTNGFLTVTLEITDIGLSPQPFAIGNADVIFKDKVIARCGNLGLQLSEKL